MAKRAVANQRLVVTKSTLGLMDCLEPYLTYLDLNSNPEEKLSAERL
jgi:hypothetical protein